MQKYVLIEFLFHAFWVVWKPKNRAFISPNVTKIEIFSSSNTSCLFPHHPVMFLCKWFILLQVVYFRINGEAIRALSPRPLSLVSWPFRLKHWLTAVNMTSLLAVVAVLAVLSAGFCEEQKNFLQRAGVAFNSREYKSLLTVSNGERFGTWTWPEMCPESFFAVGFSVRVKQRLSKML